MREEVCGALRGSLNTWQYNLQAKWGDPRAYEAEQVERLKQDARLAHDLSRRNTQLLEDAYATQAERNRSSHSKRMGALKSRDYRSAGRRPRSEAAPARSRTAPRPSPPPAEPPPDRPPGSE
jgi:hypothetical protein